MARTLAELKQEVLQLPRKERIQLAQYLLEMLDPKDDVFDPKDDFIEKPLALSETREQYLVYQEDMTLAEPVSYISNNLQEARVSVSSVEDEFLRTDKISLQQSMNALFDSLSITNEPISAEMLQEQMSGANLEPNEISQGLIAMREA